MKVIIADDERLICEWLTYCIEGCHRFELVGVAKNGEEALALYKKHKPELVLTDIKMPIMTGLDLLREIKKINPKTHVVLLTAFSEFNYAREAIRDGADEYLLKTEINKNMLHDYFEKIYQQLSIMNHQSDDLTLIKKHPKIKHLLTKQEDLNTSDLQDLVTFGFNKYQSNFVVLSFWRSEIINLEKNLLQDIIKDDAIVLYSLETNQYVYSVIITLDENLSELQKINTIYDIINRAKSKSDLRMGVSKIEAEFKAINHLIYESLYTLALTFYEKECRIQKSLRDFSLAKIRKQEDVTLIRATTELQKISTARKIDQLNRIESFYDYIEKQRFMNVRKIKQFSLDIVELLYSEFANHLCDYAKREIKSIKQQIKDANKFDEVRKITVDYAQGFNASYDISKQGLSVPIANAVEYIYKNYQQSISLEEVAKAVDLNPEYLSRCFKKEVGKTYSSFLSNIRLEKAKVLLLETNEQVQYIAESVGYFNVSYFSTLFKKEYGLNPFEYRKQNH
ncbi:MAG TPA: response regulator [Erysipelothrix sp.]